MLVRRIPSLEDYFSILALMGKGQKCTTEDLNHCSGIFSLWTKKLNLELEFVIELNRKLLLNSHVSMFPTSNGCWSSISQGLYINDDPDLAKLFENFENVKFLHDNISGPVHAFWKHDLFCAIPLLSKSVKIETVPQYVSYTDSKMSLIMKQTIPLIQRWIFWNKSQEYDEIAKVVEPRLGSFSALLCGDVIQFFKLPGAFPNGVSRQVALALDEDKVYLYVTKNSSADYHAVFLELSRWFNRGVESHDLALFATSFNFMKESGNSIDSFLKRNGCHSFSDASALETLSKAGRMPPDVEWNMHLPAFMMSGLDSYVETVASNLEDETPVPEPRQGKHGPVAVWPPPPPGGFQGAGASGSIGLQQSRVERGVSSSSVHGEGARGTAGEAEGEAGSIGGIGRSCHDSDLIPNQSFLQKRVSTTADLSSGQYFDQAGHSDLASASVQHLQHKQIATPDALVGSTCADECSVNGDDRAAAGTSENISREDTDCRPTHAPTRPGAEAKHKPAVSGRGPDVNSVLPPLPAALFELAPSAGNEEMSVEEMPLDVDGAAAAAASGTLPLEPAVARCLLSPEACESVGRYGEALVVAHLLRTAPARVSVKWLNAAGETGASCDIVTEVLLAFVILHGVASMFVVIE